MNKIENTLTTYAIVDSSTNTIVTYNGSFFLSKDQAKRNLQQMLDNTKTTSHYKIMQFTTKMALT